MGKLGRWRIVLSTTYCVVVLLFFPVFVVLCLSASIYTSTGRKCRTRLGPVELLFFPFDWYLITTTRCKEYTCTPTNQVDIVHYTFHEFVPLWAYAVRFITVPICFWCFGVRFVGWRGRGRRAWWGKK